MTAFVFLGACADIVAFPGNPAGKIAATAGVDFVMRAGTCIANRRAG